jgi:DNA repair protein RAD51
MTTDPEPQMEQDDGGLPGPGAPTPLSALEVRPPSTTPPLCLVRECGRILIVDQGIAGLTARDVKLVVDGGFHTVESVAYT